MNNIIWSDENNRIKMADDRSLIIEEKFFSPMYQETIWLHIPDEKRRAYLLEKVLKQILNSYV